MTVGDLFGQVNVIETLILMLFFVIVICADVQQCAFFFAFIFIAIQANRSHSNELFWMRKKLQFVEYIYVSRWGKNAKLVNNSQTPIKSHCSSAHWHIAIISVGSGQSILIFQLNIICVLMLVRSVMKRSRSIWTFPPNLRTV